MAGLRSGRPRSRPVLLRAGGRGYRGDQRRPRRPRSTDVPIWCRAACRRGLDLRPGPRAIEPVPAPRRAAQVPGGRADSGADIASGALPPSTAGPGRPGPVRPPARHMARLLARMPDWVPASRRPGRARWAAGVQPGSICGLDRLARPKITADLIVLMIFVSGTVRRARGAEWVPPDRRPRSGSASRAACPGRGPAPARPVGVGSTPVTSTITNSALRTRVAAQTRRLPPVRSVAH
jgi:hypothetical protein